MKTVCASPVNPRVGSLIMFIELSNSQFYNIKLLGDTIQSMMNGSMDLIRMTSDNLSLFLSEDLTANTLFSTNIILQEQYGISFFIQGNTVVFINLGVHHIKDYNEIVN